MKAKSIKGKSTEDIKAEIYRSMEDGFQPTLAFVFLSIKQNRNAICEILNKEGIEIIGATSAGEFINGFQDEGSAVIMLLDLPTKSFMILFEDVGNRDQGSVAASIAESALKNYEKPGFILCTTSLTRDGEFFDGNNMVRNIEKVVGPNVNIYGGMAGDDITFTGTFVFNKEKSSDNGIVALVLDERKIKLIGMAISGWKPLGIQRTVTKSEGRLIYTIDNLPAVDMYLKYLGNEKLSGGNKYEMFDNIGAHYPFQVKREIGEPAMVTPIGIDKEKNALICESDVLEGSVFHFSMPPDFDIVETVLEGADELKNSSQTEADALLIFSCIGRQASMGPFATSENEGLAKVWNSPMAGFFTYGEYGRAVNGRQEHHSTTCSWVALKEK
jgi:hypothetical protein